ncbi:MAG: Ig-like domain-containing protein [Planctomycetota bacterium]
MRASTRCFCLGVAVATALLTACGGSSGSSGGGSSGSGGSGGTPGAPSALASTVGATAKVQRVPADGKTEITFTVTAIDSANLVVPGVKVNVMASGAGVVIGNPAVTGPTGQTTFTATSTVPEKKTFTVRLGEGASLITLPSVTVDYYAPLTVPTISAASSPIVGKVYALQVPVAGGTPPYSFALEPATSLPLGLALGAGGRISGVPTQQASFSYAVRVTDAQGLSAVFQHSGSTVAAGTISFSAQVPALPTFTTGAPLTFSPFFQAGGISPFSFSYTGLPAGLSFDAQTGVVSGTATAGGSASLTVKDGANNQTQPIQLTITVQAPAANTGGVGQ